jgi:hypothetical protein
MDSAHPDAQLTITFHDIDLRIRALATILSILDPQASSPTKGPLVSLMLRCILLRYLGQIDPGLFLHQFSRLGKLDEGPCVQ